MAKPVVKTIHAFDASAAYTIEFTWSGNQAYNNRIVIYNAATQTPVYEDIYPNNHYTLNHEIPAYTLDNNKQYAIQVQVIDITGDPSAFSDKYYFYTISTPDFYFDGLSEESVVYSPTVNLNLVYSQSGTETLTWVRYHLYDATKTVVTETNPDYGCAMTHSFRGLINKAIYYARATGVTVHGMALDTGYIRFSTSYQNPSAYARIYAEAEEDTGFVNYYSNIVVISPDSDDYTYEDGFIDLTEIDPNVSISIKTTTTPNTSMEADWLDIDGEYHLSKTNDSNTGVTITGFKIVDEVIINGNTVQDGTPTTLGDFHEISSVTDCTLTVNRIPVENVTQGMRLARLPINGHDKLSIKWDSTRTYTQEVGYYKFSKHDYAVITGMEGSNFVTYYDLGGMKKSVPNNMYCTCIPVNSSYRTSISMDYDTGYIKIVWRNDRGISTEDAVREFFKSNDVTILFPLAQRKTIYLDHISPMPSLENHKLLRYSQALKIPGDRATWAIRMKDCRKSTNFLKVFTKDRVNFMLTGRVYEDNTFRLILTVYGAGQKYLQYSDPIIIDHDDIVTVYIRRIDGIYGMYINVFESEDIDFNNVWLGEDEPTGAALEDKDLWIDLEQDLIMIPHDDVVTFYQYNEPAEAENNNIWLGKEEL